MFHTPAKRQRSRRPKFTVVSANNHVRSTTGPDSPCVLQSYPDIPEKNEVVGPESGMIKPPYRPDD